MGTDGENKKGLLALRDEIERVDTEIVRLIRERARLGQQIGMEKQLSGAPVLAPDREAAVVRKAAELANELDLPEEDIRKVMWILIGISRKLQQK